MNQSEFEANSCNRRQARENAYEQITIGFSLASHWSRNCREFFYPIIERTEAKPKQTRITFDTELKTVLLCTLLFAAKTKRKDMVKDVLNNVDSEGSTLLHLAVDSGSSEVCTLK